MPLRFSRTTPAGLNQHRQDLIGFNTNRQWNATLKLQVAEATGGHYNGPHQIGLLSLILFNQEGT